MSQSSPSPGEVAPDGLLRTQFVTTDATRPSRAGAGHAEVNLITCEYPPTLGGVSDYTCKVANTLAQRGYRVRVWAPGHERPATTDGSGSLPGVKVSRSFGRFGLRSILAHERLMGAARGQSILLQWEPVGFGCYSVNLPFCLWIASRALRGTRLAVMFHETFLPLNRRSVKRYVAGGMQRVMTFGLVNTAERVFVSTESGALSLRQLSFRPGRILPLPVFSNIEGTAANKQRIDAARAEFAAPSEVLVGHFGRFMEPTRPYVTATLESFLRSNVRAKVLLIGECGSRYRADLLSRQPGLASRVYDSGVRDSEEVATLIGACDVMLQPYPEGLTTKRSSTMASLSQGRCVVSNRGPQTERIWNDCAGLCLLETLDPEELSAELSRLLGAPAELAERSTAASVFYHKHFSSEHTVDAILATLEDPSPLRRHDVSREPAEGLAGETGHSAISEPGSPEN